MPATRAASASAGPSASNLNTLQERNSQYIRSVDVAIMHAGRTAQKREGRSSDVCIHHGGCWACAGPHQALLTPQVLKRRRLANAPMPIRTSGRWRDPDRAPMGDANASAVAEAFAGGNAALQLAY
jgi:hypothetical protein